MCRDKLKAFHEYYTFVLRNQEVYKEKLNLAEDLPSAEFVAVAKEDPQDEQKDEKPKKACCIETLKSNPTKKRRVQRPRSHVLALQKQQSDLILLLFDLKCNECKHRPIFSLYRQAINHYRLVHKKARIWICCGKQMSRDVELIEHVMEHEGTWKCEPCVKEFPTAVELWMHDNENHCEPSVIPYEDPRDWLKLQFECDMCGKKFRTRGDIARHMKEMHIKNSVCDICKESFFNNAARSRHRREEHAQILKIPCNICGVLITNKPSRMEAHIKNSHISQNMICPTCGKVCKNDVSIRMHMIREHKPPKHECRHCGKRFKTTNHLRDHEAVSSSYIGVRR